MSNYKVIVASRADSQLLQHIEFLARVSIPAAKKFRDAYSSIVERLEENPFQFPMETEYGLPEGLYRKAIFAKRYKALFSVEAQVVYVDAVLDCRQENNDWD